MRHLYTAAFGWGLILLSLVTMVMPVHAESGGASHADVILLLDRSGSMARNDPHDLSLTAASLFVGMLDPNDRVAVLAFDSGVRTVRALGVVGDGAATRKAIETAGKATGQWTDLKAAVKAALQQLDGQARPDRQATVLLFTDGKPEVQDDGVPAGYLDELNADVNRLAGRAVPLFTVGLGQADFTLLRSMAMATHGESLAAASDSQVVPLFTDILSRVKERQVVVSLEEDGTLGVVRTFRVSPYTRLLTLSAVGTRGDLRLEGKAPDGTPLAAIPKVQTASGANYVVYTIADPMPGTWQVKLLGKGRVQLQGQTESALRLLLRSPAPYAEVDASKPVRVNVGVTGDPDPSSPLELWAQSRTAAGEPGQPVKLDRANGEYTGEVTVPDGQFVLWAVRAGIEITRREFRFYPGAVTTPQSANGAPAPPAQWRWLVVAGALVVALGGTLIGLGAVNWRRIKRRQEQLGGRLGGLGLSGLGREVPLGPGPAVARPGALPRATLTARLVPSAWAPLVGLGLGSWTLQIHIRPVPGIRLQVNGRPPTDGRLYHGDEVQLGDERFTFQNHSLPRRKAREGARPLRIRSNKLRG